MNIRLIGAACAMTAGPVGGTGARVADHFEGRVTQVTAPLTFRLVCCETLPGLADLAPWPLTWRTAAMSGAATVAYFALQTGAVAISAGTLPPPPQPDGLIWAAIVLAVSSFALAAVAQATFPLWAGHPAAAGLREYLGR